MLSGQMLRPPRRTLAAAVGRAAGAVRLVGGIGLLLLGACQAQPGAAGSARAVEGVPQTEAALLARIHQEIGDARCSSDAQCRTLPIGEKACGGPASWLAWSTSQGREGPLQAWSAELAQLQRQRQARSGMVSDCRYLPDPGARCVAQRCVLTSSRNAN